MTDNMGNERGHCELSTKQKILNCAVNLFAQKGFTETSIRELADAVGLKGASIYNHFPSKNAILEYILEDYSKYSTNAFDENAARAKLSENPTVTGVIDCLILTFPSGKTDYYLKVLCVLLQEQHRSPLIHDYMSNEFFMGSEYAIKTIFRILKDLGAVRRDADPDPWVKTYSSLLYTFSSRMLLGIGDASPGFTGMGMTDIIRFQFSLMFSTCAVSDNFALSGV